MQFDNGKEMRRIELKRSTILLSFSTVNDIETTSSLDCFSSEFLRSLSMAMCDNRMANMDETCHKNHKSISFMYEVFGKSALIELSKVAITRTAVADPMNLSLKSSKSICKVEYPNNQSKDVGINVFKS